VNVLDRLRFAYTTGKAIAKHRADSRPKPRISKWAEKRAEEKRREMIEGPQREIIASLAESLEKEMDTMSQEETNESYRIECRECGAIEFGDSETELQCDIDWHRDHHCPGAEFEVQYE